MKRFLKIFLLSLGVVALLYAALHVYIKHKLEKAIAKTESASVQYQEMSLNLWSGNLSFDELQVSHKQWNAAVKHLAVHNLSYSQLLWNDKIAITSLKLQQPDVVYHQPTDSLPQQSTSPGNSQNKPKKPIYIDQVEVKNGRFLVRNDTLEKLKIASFSIDLKQIKLSEETLQQSVPFTYTEADVNVKNLKYDVNTLQRLALDSLHLSQDQLEVKGVYLLPKFSRSAYTEHIPYEKDLMDLKLDRLYIPDYNVEFASGIPQFTAPMVKLQQVKFTLYRDKTITDDTRKKKLYSRMLRELDLKIGIDSLRIENADIVYEERIKADRKPGRVHFADLSASITSLTNMDLDRPDFPTTRLAIKTQFMKKSPLQVNWNFKVNDTTDYFTISGSSHNIPTASMNAFFIPAFQVKASGEGVDDLYFNFSGNAEQARGQLKMRYDNFKVSVLKKNGDENKLLSWVANIFVKKDAKNGESQERVTGVKRDKTKSFWNYFWSCLEAGLKKTFI